MKKKKKKLQGKTNPDIERMNPLIVINEPDECLFAIVDFPIPGNNHVRRVISKRLKSGNISAVMYEGKVGADNTCVSKKNIMTMEDMPQEKFWKAVNILSLLYQAVGGVSDIRLYEGKTLKEAADIMRRFDHAKVWMTPCDGK
ncbi:MAG: hypothetical protein WCX65_12455 [bacterium]